MGLCCSDHNTKVIDTKLKENEKYEKSCHKLLFLGPGGGGKSTIFKQLQWLYGHGFTDEESQTSLKGQIHMQIIKQMHTALYHYCSEPTSNNELESHIDKVRSYRVHIHKLPADIAQSIAFIWKNDARLKGIFNKPDQKQIMWPSTEYFWNALDRVSVPDYTVTTDDVLQVRNMSTGVVEKRFNISGNVYHIFDVGGQKSERKKWVHCFDDVEAMIFVVALTSYDEIMFEDKKTNCMVDAMELFENMINHIKFVQTPIILFLNKTDLFQEKVKEIPITTCSLFEDFDENAVYHEAHKDAEADEGGFYQPASFIKNKFEECNRSRRDIYTHFTCAVDNKSIDRVFQEMLVNVVANIDKKYETTQDMR